MTSNFTLRGVITALVTPFTNDGFVDEVALRELVQFQLKSKVNGFFALGTTGTGPAMDVSERKRVAEIVVKETDRRVPVVVQVGDSHPATSLGLARHAQQIGADAVASLTPFYYHPGAEATLNYFETLSRSIGLPVLVYNIPPNTGNNVDAKLLLKLSKISRIVGIKDSSRDFSQLLDYLQIAPEGFNIINGTDSYLFSAFCAGVQAGVSATANPFPEIFVKMYDAYKAGDLDVGKILQGQIHSLRVAMAEPPIAPLLEALKMRGLRGGFVKSPLRSMHAAEIENLRSSISRVLPEMHLEA